MKVQPTTPRPSLPKEVAAWLGDDGLPSTVMSVLGTRDDTSPGLRDWLARHHWLNPFRHGDVDPMIVREFALSEDPNERVLAALCPSTADDLLNELSSDSDPEVRKMLGENWSAPAEVLEALAKDDDEEVRSSLLYTCGELLTDSTLQRLVDDKSESVREFAGDAIRRKDRCEDPRDLARRRTAEPDYWA